MEQQLHLQRETSRQGVLFHSISKVQVLIGLALPLVKVVEVGCIDTYEWSYLVHSLSLPL